MEAFRLSRALFLIVLLLSARPLPPALDFEQAPERRSTLASARHAAEVLALASSADKRDLFKSLPLGIDHDCPAAAPVGQAFVRSSVLRSFPSVPVLSVSPNHSPPFRLA